MNESESMAMWKLYLKSNEGIAIQSRFSRLKESFLDCRDEDIYFGTVKYIDYEKDYFNSNDLFSQFVHKRSSFSHEREVRAIIHKRPTKSRSREMKNEVIQEKYIDYSENPIEYGINVKVDLSILVENVYLAPGSPDWLHDLVYSVTKIYGYNFNIHRSSTNADPLF